MEAARSTTYRLLMLLLIILIWFGLGNAAFSFAIGKVVGGAIEFAVSLALIALAVEGRVVRLLEGRRLNSLSLLVFAVAALVLVFDGVESLRFNETSLLGEVYLPGIITIVRAAGEFVLASVLIWEVGRLALSKA
ncbi:MAG TPA: hypothetical protein VJK02_25635 [Anaerolineales bacterium]|nr:hypothetical protein [Anaerolineales bacterium]